MVHNLRSIGMLLIQNSGQDGCQLKPTRVIKNNKAVSLTTACSSSLNNPVRKRVSILAGQNSWYGQNANVNHDGDTYVSLMSSFEECKEETKRKTDKRRKRTKNSGKMDAPDTDTVENMTDSDIDFGLDSSSLLRSTYMESVNTSNNSLLQKSSSSNDSGVVLNDKKFVCSVLNCAAHFSSEIRLDDHMELFKHSPCNPCLLVPNCNLSTIPVCYMCPGCDREFSSHEECKTHIRKTNHLTFYPPLAIKAYMCSQCLFLFPNLELCWHHMEKASHFGIYYPFQNDYTTDEKFAGPVAVTEELVHDLISKCSKVVYTVQCLECGMPIENPAILKHHMRETQGQHVMAALTETSLVEVFSTYLASYSCNVCHRLFTGELKELAKHQCAQRYMGTITENDTKSFAEFIKRCGLNVIKSLEPENQPGPSRVPTLSPVHNRKTRRLDRSKDMKTDHSNERRSKLEQPDQSDSDCDVTSPERDPESENGTRQKDRKSDWDAFIDPAILESSKLVVHQTNDVNPERDKFMRKTEKEEKNTKKEADDVVVITDSDESVEEIELDFSAGSGSKRKRTSKAAVSSNKKKESPRGVLSDPIIISASPKVTRANTKDGKESPFFALNYRPKTSCLDTRNIQNNDISAIPPLLGRFCDDKPLRVDPSVKYELRNRKVSETFASADIQDDFPEISDKSDIPSKHSDIPPRDTDDIPRHSKNLPSKSTRLPENDVSLPEQSDNRFKNYTQNQTHRTDMNAECALDEHTAEDHQQNRRDRSRSPLDNLIPYDHFSNTPLSSSNYRIHQSSIYTSTPNRHPNFDPFLGIHIVTPVSQQQAGGTSRYPLRNHPSTAIVTPLLQASPATVLSQTSLECQHPTKNTSLEQAFIRSGASTSKEYSMFPDFGKNSINFDTARKPSRDTAVTPAYLQRMKNIVFLDLDNWPSFFHKLPRCLPDLTFVWGFFGGRNPWYEPNRLAIFRQMKQNGMFYLNDKCGTTKDAADFAIVLTVGKMDEKLPSDIAFTIMSGDKGFCEVERQMKDSERKVMVINPHTAAQFSNDMIYALVTSVTDM